MTVSLLLENGFLPVGCWKTADCRPYKAAKWLHSQPGLYAFAVGSVVMYVGRSITLHRRLRNYGNRAFRNKNVPQRGPHLGIASSVVAGIEVAVFAKVLPCHDEAQLQVMETKLRHELNPAWDGLL